MCLPYLNCVTIFLERTATFCDFLKEEKIDGNCVADNLFQSSRPGDFDLTPPTSTLPLTTGGTKLQSYTVFPRLERARSISFK